MIRSDFLYFDTPSTINNINTLLVFCLQTALQHRGSCRELVLGGKQHLEVVGLTYYLVFLQTNIMVVRLWKIMLKIQPYTAFDGQLCLIFYHLPVPSL